VPDTAFPRSTVIVASTTWACRFAITGRWRRDIGVGIDDGLLNTLVAIDVDAWTDYRDDVALAATFRAAAASWDPSNGVPEIVARIRPPTTFAVVV
jgi:hypothetical protein